MDFKTKNFKERHHNYNSLAEFPRPFQTLPFQDPRPTHFKSKDNIPDISSPLPFLRINKENTNTHSHLQIRLEALEDRVQTLENSKLLNSSVKLAL